MRGLRTGDGLTGGGSSEDRLRFGSDAGAGEGVGLHNGDLGLCARAF
jgi:hypothetical protein